MDKSKFNDFDDAEVEKVMHMIKENIRKRRAGYDTTVSTKSPEIIRNEAHPYTYEDQKSLDYINSNWDIINDSYYISSHRPIIGKILVKGRELVYGEICRYVDPQISKQTEFNANLVKIINDMIKKISELEERIKVLENDTN